MPETPVRDTSAIGSKPRDVRLDLFRGVAMFVIFTAHSPGNPWNAWIPARFGFSSGAELFVFCSGVASAGAFASVFVKRGWLMGAARILYRCWQVYWAHIGLAVAVIALGALSEAAFPGRNFAAAHVGPLMADAPGAFLGLVTLTWLPLFLDILPMYLVILAAIPVLMAARQAHPFLPHLIVVAFYGASWMLGLNLTGNPWTGDVWFFNPFAWQLMFFLGFFMRLGWLPVPELRDRRLVMACAAFVALSVPLTFWGILNAVPDLQALNSAILGPAEKVNLHPLRVLHFLALAYLVLSWIEPLRGHLGQGPERFIIKVGQQSLATFLASIYLAIAGGVAFAVFGTDLIAAIAVNGLAIVWIVAVAYSVAWFKGEPWRKPPQPARVAAPAIDQDVRTTARDQPTLV